MGVDAVSKTENIIPSFGLDRLIGTNYNFQIVKMLYRVFVKGRLVATGFSGIARYNIFLGITTI